MTVGADAVTVDGYPEFGFCSEHCRTAFVADPEKYLGETSDSEPAQATVTAPQPSMATAAKIDSTHLVIQGMTCASCVTTVQSALGSVPGVADARVNLAAEEPTVDLVHPVATDDLMAAVSPPAIRRIP